MNAWIVLDAETAPLVPVGAGIAVGGRTMILTNEGQAMTGDRLTHLPTPTGVHPVAKVVAEHGWLREIGALVRVVAWPAHADKIDAIADRLIDQRLVAAWHTQHPDGPS